MTERVPDLDAAVAASIPQEAPAVLAVSGGLDSMVLLDLVGSMRAAGSAVDAVVATFDHASGTHSRRAAAFVVRRALDYGLEVVTSRAPKGLATEAAWREARWGFLDEVSSRVGGVVLTAHTRDDQVETVYMRALRGAGARGLAGLYAESAVRRPFLDVSRAELRAYALARHLQWLEDPTNQSRRFLRNRVRLDHLPALRRACRAIDAELLAIARRAAEWRGEVAAMVDAAVTHHIGRDERCRPTLDVAVASLRDYSPAALAVVWPELAARVGATLDRRGTRRAAEFTISGSTGRRIQLAGGWQLVRSREYLQLRAADAADEAPSQRAPGGRGAQGAQGVAAPLAGDVTWDGLWSFRVMDEADVAARPDAWIARLPSDRPLVVRRWQPGDRMSVRRGDRLVVKKVKSLLSDAAVTGHVRGRWPVVVRGDEVVWVPGVCRTDAATERSGWPVVTYVCDYLDRRS